MERFHSNKEISICRSSQNSDILDINLLDHLTKEKFIYEIQL
jgi:hypothetical protein